MSLSNKFVGDHSAKIERANFLRASIIVEGGISALALVTGAALGLPVWTNMTFSGEAIGLGIIATIPLIIMLRWTYFSQSQGLVEIHRLLLNLLGKPLACCGWLDLCMVAILAGVSEECLFRGVLEPLLGRWNSIGGLVAGNLIFGLCHAVTPTYFVYAALMGCYLSMTLRLTAEPNLVVPITEHALYDLIAFVVIRTEYLERVSKTLTGLQMRNEIAEPSDETPLGLDA